MLTAAELQHLLAKVLAGATGRDAQLWRWLIGEVQIFPLATHPSCNWTIHPEGDNDERLAIYRAVEVVRAQHPHARQYVAQSSLGHQLALFVALAFEELKTI